MLINAKKLKGYKLEGLDGEIGKVKEFYFDDQHWAIRYLVADTGNWLSEKQVLISPYSLGDVNEDGECIFIKLTKKQIEDSPSLDSDKPVSRQFEESYYGYYGCPPYWSGAYMWGTYPYIVRDRERWPDMTRNERTWDPHLRSTHAVDGHHVQAIDGEIGHIRDFLIDVDTWAIRYLIIDTRNWLPGKNVLISPQWIERISWTEGKVFINLSREAIKHSAEYTEAPQVTRDYETELYRHYWNQGYWTDKPVDNEKPR